jgi:HK97 family phage major capsid protein
MAERLATLTAEQEQRLGLRDLLRFLSAKAYARGSTAGAVEHFRERWPDSARMLALRTKAVAPGSTTDPDWAGVLVTPPPVSPLLAVVRRESLLGRVSGFRQVPFSVTVPVETTGGTFGWVVQGGPKPATRLTFDSLSLSVGKIAGIVALTSELVKLAAPGSEEAMRSALIGGLVAFQDDQMLDPAITEIANTRPASLTNGVTPTASTGNLTADVATLLSTFFAARPEAQKPTLVLSPGMAGRLAADSGSSTLMVDGGSYAGLPVVTTPSAGPDIVALDAAAVVYSDGGLEVDVSEQAAVQMDAAPTGPDATTVVTSFWQLGLVGFRVERELWWDSAPDSVQLLTVTP